MKIVFSGGGTLGPVTPLLAIHEVIKREYPQARFFWVGTRRGAERALVRQAGIPFASIATGKLRRYLSLFNLIDLFKMIGAFFHSLAILWHVNPDACISAGGFTSVPLHWAAWLLGIPTWIHQQDIRIGLANKFMAPCARVITTALQIHTNRFPARKTIWLGNPVRSAVLHGSIEAAQRQFNLSTDLPVVFVTGGGTGSLRVNQLVVEAVPHLGNVCQIIHLTGTERPQELAERTQAHYRDRYQVYQFFTDEMKLAYAAADLIISRGGFGTLSEIAAVHKPAIVIPKPGHQVENVRFFEQAGAVVRLNETTANGLYLAQLIKDLLAASERRETLAAKLATLLPLARREDILRVLKHLLPRV